MVSRKLPATTVVKWTAKSNPRRKAVTIDFKDLVLGSTFKILEGEAVYRKVQVRPSNTVKRHSEFLAKWKQHQYEFGMEEIVTGRVFEPTDSACILVKVKIEIARVKPPLYSKKQTKNEVGQVSESNVD